MNKPNNIFLIGLMGSGKTSVGRYLAKELGKEFYDVDQYIEAKAGADIRWIFDVEGEQGFREREIKAIAELTQKQNVVLATGGGAILREENRKALSAQGMIIYLRASIEVLLQRTQYSRHRPLLLVEDRQAIFEKLAGQREGIYYELADLIYETDGYSVNELGKKIVRDLKNENTTT